MSYIMNLKSNQPANSSFCLFSALFTVALLTPFVSATAVAQEPPRLVLTDSRGTGLEGSLTIGLTLLASIDNGQPYHHYGFALLDEVGAVVADSVGTTDHAGFLPPVPLWKKSGVMGCDPPPEGGGLPPAPDGYQSSTFEEAALALSGRVFVVALIDLDTGAWADTVNIALEESSDPIYFFSDSRGCPRDQFNEGEKIYLSVTQGEQGPILDRRIFVIEKPNWFHWREGYNFEDARQPEICADPEVTDCPVFPTGEITELPQTQTVELQGPFPEDGRLIAVVREATGSTETHRLACDQASEYSMYYTPFATGPHSTEPNESWGCPPCPPG